MHGCPRYVIKKLSTFVPVYKMVEVSYRANNCNRFYSECFMPNKQTKPLYTDKLIKHLNNKIQLLEHVRTCHICTLQVHHIWRFKPLHIAISTCQNLIYFTSQVCRIWSFSPLYGAVMTFGSFLCDNLQEHQSCNLQGVCVCVIFRFILMEVINI